MNYIKIRDLTIDQKGHYGIGASASTYNQSYPQYLRITDINDYGYAPKILSTSIDVKKYPDWKKYLLHKYDIVFARTGNSTGRNFMLLNDSIPTVFAGFLIKFSIDSKKIEPRYLAYYCQSKNYWNQVKSLFTGSTRNNVNAEQYAELKIPMCDAKLQHHIVNTIGSVDDLIENYQKQADKICNILRQSLNKYNEYVTISEYDPDIIKSGIKMFDNEKTYLDTSSINGVNNITPGELITYNKKPSRANMQPIVGSVWFAKMKDSNKILIITDKDQDIIKNNILSTGFLGIKSSNKLPLSLLTSIIISDQFKVQRDLNSVGTTMAGINNETFSKILVPKLTDEEKKKYDKKYNNFVYRLSYIRQEIKLLSKVKENLLSKHF